MYLNCWIFLGAKTLKMEFINFRSRGEVCVFAVSSPCQGCQAGVPSHGQRRMVLSLPGPRCARAAPWLLSASQQRGAVCEHPRFWSLHDVCPRVGAGWPEIHEFWMVLHLGFFQTQWLSLTLVCFGLCDRQSVGYQGAWGCSGILVLLCLSL